MHSRGPTEQSSDVLHLQGTSALECSTLLLALTKPGAPEDGQLFPGGKFWRTIVQAFKNKIKNSLMHLAFKY